MMMSVTLQPAQLLATPTWTVGRYSYRSNCVERVTTSPERFAIWFNAKVPGAYRQVSADDIRDMTTCGLIGKYSEYITLDIETVRAILQYEQLRQNRQKRAEIRDTDGAIHCRRCGVVLAARPDGKRGRPVEYCHDCEPLGGRERYRRWWQANHAEYQTAGE